MFQTITYMKWSGFQGFNGCNECNSYHKRYNPILLTSSPQTTRRETCKDTKFLRPAQIQPRGQCSYCDRFITPIQYTVALSPIHSSTVKY